MLTESDYNPPNNPNFLRYNSRNTPFYKSLCLIMYIVTSDEYWHLEGTHNDDNFYKTQFKEMKDE